MKKLLLWAVCAVNVMYCNRVNAQGSSLFDNTLVHKIVIKPYFEGIVDSLTNNYILSFGMGQTQTRKIPYLATAIEIDGTLIDSVGLRYKGFNSWWHSVKKPLKIDMNEYVPKTNYDGIKKFNLHNGSGDPSFLRENISYQLFRELGIKVPRTAYAEVYFYNNYMGLYRMVEQVDNTFLDVNFGNHSGNLYVQQSPNTAGFSFEWNGSDPLSYKNQISLENHQTTNNWTDFIHFLDVLNNSSDNDFKTSILSVFDVYEYLKILAVDILLNNVDYYGNSGRNYYLYHDTDGDGKFHWIPWDYNLTWFQDPGALKLDPESYPLLMNRLLKVPEFSDYYLSVFCNLKNVYTSDFVNSFIERDTAIIRKYLAKDEFLDYSMEAFDKNQQEAWESLPGLKPYAEQRRMDIASLISTEKINCSSNGIPQNEGLAELSVFPVPANQYFSVQLPNERKVELVLQNMNGLTMRQVFISGNEPVDVSSLPAGIYIVRLKSNKAVFGKLVVVH